MRYLNKIIFINSAHIPYAEVKLDGNVHFIGTQGVGKSTLLRAILFFYNADKANLGISREQRGFDEFYLPTPDAFIIYEVCRENGNYFIAMTKHQGRAAYHFVDCPYNKDFFINPDGSVNYEWNAIRRNIGPDVYVSNLVRQYSYFLDIIYGNQQKVEKELRRFSLMESAKYDNVPRTIQNIFLNQSLESRVIKDTIIDSMDFANDQIDLNFYRDHVKNFRQQYEDIWKWYKKEKNGKVKVQTDAENIISKYSSYELTQKAIRTLCGNMLFALDRDQQQLPQIKNDQDECTNELNRQKAILSEESRKYNDERDKLNREEGILKHFLDTAKSKHRHYDEIGIEHIIAQIERESELNLQQKNLREQEDVLTDKNQSVKSKYDALKQKVNSGLLDFKLEISGKRNQTESELTQSIRELQTERNRQLDHINQRFNELAEAIQEERENCLKEKTMQEGRRMKIQQMNPFQEKMDALRHEIETLHTQQEKLKLESVEKNREVEDIKHDTEMRCKDLEIKRDADIAEINHRIADLSHQMEEIDELLGQQKGSLIEWLGENVKDWENNIGKVLDEKRVLYNTELQPTCSESSDSIFGVKLDVENLECTVRTPDALKAEKKQLEDDLHTLKESIVKRREQCDKEMEELKRRPSADIKRLQMELISIRAELTQLPITISNNLKALEEENDKLTLWRKQQTKEINELIEKAEVKLVKLGKDKEKQQNQRKRELEKAESHIAELEQQLTDEAEKKKADYETQLIQRSEETARQLKELEIRMDEELKGQGVDVEQLAGIRKQLQEIQKDLQFIKDHRKEYYSWQNDKDEYFNKEKSKDDKRKQVHQKIKDLQKKYDERRKKLSEEISRLSKQEQKLINQQKELREGIDRVTTFIQTNESSLPELSNTERIETYIELGNILEDLRNQISSQQRKMEEFKMAVNTFKRNFSAQNTFHFRTEFNADSDYTEFAAELNEFMSNHKIEDYRIRTSETYAVIIQRISREVGDLANHQSQIQSTINDINKDFRENNFAGVIKEIELRAVDSNDPLMQQLFNIKKFDDNNGFNVGAFNLFSERVSIEEMNEQAVKHLMILIDLLDADQKREKVSLADTFKLEFKVKENDNDSNWVERLSNIGSDGTDILVKAMVNIMLINVFKRKISRKFGDFKLHCMMDEIGKLHPNNVEGILDFANKRNIYLINSSPTTYNASAYRYTYSLSKDDHSNTMVKSLLTIQS